MARCGDFGKNHIFTIDCSQRIFSKQALDIQALNSKIQNIELLHQKNILQNSKKSLNSIAAKLSFANHANIPIN